MYDEEYQKLHLERLEKKIEYRDEFLVTAEERRGAGVEEVKSNITDNGRAKIQGAHGYIQGYTGIAVAESKAMDFTPFGRHR